MRDDQLSENKNIKEYDYKSTAAGLELIKSSVENCSLYT